MARGPITSATFQNAITKRMAENGSLRISWHDAPNCICLARSGPHRYCVREAILYLYLLETPSVPYPCSIFSAFAKGQPFLPHSQRTKKISDWSVLWKGKPGVEVEQYQAFELDTFVFKYYFRPGPRSVRGNENEPPIRMEFAHHCDDLTHYVFDITEKHPPKLYVRWHGTKNRMKSDFPYYGMGD